MKNGAFLMCEMKKFTIIELLVSIAIIAVIAQMLIPILSIAKKKAQEIKCMSNMKQINTAVSLYSEDFGYYPYGNSTLLDFPNSIKSYIWPFSEQSSPLLECAAALHSTNGAVWITYAVHPVIFPDFLATPPQTKFWKAGKIRRVSDTIMIMEACQGANASCYPTLKSIPGILPDPGVPDVPSKSNDAIVGDFEDHDQDGVAGTNDGWPRFRHTYERANTAFADGHTTNVKIKTITEGNVKTSY